MKTLLDKRAVAERLGVQPKTAAMLMMEMNPVVISGNVRKRYRVTEENLDRWVAKRTTGRPKTGSVSMGSKRRLERR
ncbi:MAG: hypothetical protein J6Y60_03435 [Treponema sp.]|nr:hypothetical protein [Treponema sp.]